MGVSGAAVADGFVPDPVLLLSEGERDEGGGQKVIRGHERRERAREPIHNCTSRRRNSGPGRSAGGFPKYSPGRNRK